VNFISLPQEVRGIFVIKAAVEMQNNPAKEITRKRIKKNCQYYK
jgi:hypothetical protein